MKYSHNLQERTQKKVLYIYGLYSRAEFVFSNPKTLNQEFMVDFTSSNLYPQDLISYKFSLETEVSDLALIEYLSYPHTLKALLQ